LAEILAVEVGIYLLTFPPKKELPFNLQELANAIVKKAPTWKEKIKIQVAKGLLGKALRDYLLPLQIMALRLGQLRNLRGESTTATYPTKDPLEQAVAQLRKV